MDIEQYLSEHEMLDKSTEEAEAPNISVLSRIVRPIAAFDKEFNDIELNRLTELKTAADVITDFSGDFKYSIQITSLRDMFARFASFNLFDQTIQDVMRFCKSISTFQDVCQNDQIALFKNSYTDILSLKVLARFDCDKECFDYVIVSCSEQFNH